jgi:hypothetical protein
MSVPRGLAPEALRQRCLAAVERHLAGRHPRDAIWLPIDSELRALRIDQVDEAANAFELATSPSAIFCPARSRAVACRDTTAAFTTSGVVTYLPRRRAVKGQRRACRRS